MKESKVTDQGKEVFSYSYFMLKFSLGHFNYLLQGKIFQLKRLMHLL